MRFGLADYEIRNSDDGEVIVVGYALKFERESTGLYFREIIKREALNDADMTNVVALVNHDSNYVLGRSGKNLELEIDEIGLKFTVVLNDTTYARDLAENMRTGLIDKCSFAFTIAKDGDQWEKLSDGTYRRTISKIKKLYDVSVVTSPAYGDTEAVLSQRSIDAYEQISNEEEYRKQVLDLEVNMWRGQS